MFKKLKKSKNRLDDFIFDDCPICQAMKRAANQGRDLSLSEFKKVFAEANKKAEK